MIQTKPCERCGQRKDGCGRLCMECWRKCWRRCSACTRLDARGQAIVRSVRDGREVGPVDCPECANERGFLEWPERRSL